MLATLCTGLVAALLGFVGPSAYAADGSAPEGASSAAAQVAAATSIPDACAAPGRSYPTFGRVCVAGSAWAPAQAIAADPTYHLNVFSNGPTTQVVGGLNTYGYKWQCTELAVRWAAAAGWGEGDFNAWVHAGWSTGAAQDMWTIPHLARPLLHLSNGTSTKPQAVAPQFGDLLIFHEKATRGPGHVAIVLNVNRTTGRLTFVGENQYAAPAVVTTPISATNIVSASGLSSGLVVTGWMRPAAPTTTVSNGFGYPEDPICTLYGMTEPYTKLTMSGTYYLPGDVLFVRSAQILLGTPTVSSAGSWTLTFAVPSRPDGNYPITAADNKGLIATTSFSSRSYTCFHTQAGMWAWDAVGWDTYSPMTFYVDGQQMDYWSAFSNGSITDRTFNLPCTAGSTHTWAVTGTLNGSPGIASGRVTC